MIKINNISISGIQKKLIEFFLNKIHDFSKISFLNLDALVEQINNAEVKFEKTQYYCLMKFYYDGYSSDVYDKTVELQVIRVNSAPTVFHMYFKKMVLFEFEYFNADSSEVCEQNLCDGEVFINFY